MQWWSLAGDGRLVLPWSVDDLTWNEEAVPVDSPAAKAATKKESWISGTATTPAKQELGTRGCAVVEKRPRTAQAKP